MASKMGHEPFPYLLKPPCLIYFSGINVHPQKNSVGCQKLSISCRQAPENCRQMVNLLQVYGHIFSPIIGHMIKIVYLINEVSDFFCFFVMLTKKVLTFQIYHTQFCRMKLLHFVKFSPVYFF